MRISSETYPKAALAVGGGLLSVLMLAGCGDSKAPVVVSALEVQDLAGAPITTVSPGEVKYIQAMNPESSEGAAVIAKTPNVVDYLYPHGPQDGEAPSVTSVPTRFRTEVVLQSSRSANLANDAACDTYNISRNVQSVGAVALGGVEDGAFLVWPTRNGEPADQIELCFYQHSEPTEGVILFTK